MVSFWTIYILGGGVDYISGPYTVKIPTNVRRVPFRILITDDSIKERNETFRLVIDSSSLPDGVVVGTPSQAVITIVDVLKCKLMCVVLLAVYLCNSQIF